MLKRYTNPFGNFNWMGKNVPRFAKTVIKSGLDMLHSMGMTKSMISDELKNLMADGEIMKRLNTSRPKIPIEENGVVPLVKKEQEPVKITS